ncbi:hypothetical protein BW723_10870 [Polaribacter reichenbachii]|uniref:Uncharacterized protein n=1 Tax=Polaribacter reichenbachii TaxID=996801 RepID=A0A1B8TQ23_9FLAO|nr:hypothetical protein [Polaribacter reichenbachii]APZ46753.1 hypothetical protein BW723_10870 [Polaribacter reichenbachii]AUC17396.1 hypothetical protein BTO17_01315 [Polaribacter reichenbachii]OBY61729.1 hypothetical protein LPB301_16890 [Polaribacter reichenbachii]
MNNLEIIHNYDTVISQLIEDIKKSDFKTAYFLKLLNLKDSFFYKKMREKRFTNEEVKLISKHLYPEQYQEYKDAVIGKLLEKSKAQLKDGLGVNFEIILEKSKEKYGV